MKLFHIAAIFLFVVLLSEDVSAYLPIETHPLINELAVRQSTVDQYLKDKLLFIGGLDDAVNGRRVLQWLRQGGTDEDDFPRGVWHFHDPTKPWDQAGILSVAYSSILWAQNLTAGFTPNCQALNIRGEMPC